LEHVSLALGESLYESGAHIRHVYFLNRNTLASLVITMEDGASIEAGVVGNEGMVGVQAFLRAETTPNRVVVQVAGSALRMSADVLREEFNRGGALQNILLRYAHTLFTQVMQAAACNHLHSVEERLSRWLLMIHERATLDDLPLTQELISRRLGAHRSSIGVAADALRHEGLIHYKRGKITILDREGLKAATCGCYGVIREEFDQISAL
jgi:CRP-like cAMP-binding protein